jgi:hypothetical protein
MGLGLEMFDLRNWFAYVVAMVALEAWLIGRWAKVPWKASLGISILANLITGVMCGGLSCLAPILHGVFVGSRTDPNPFLNAIVLLAAFGVPSGWIESLVWRTCLRKSSETKFVARSILIHLVTIPVGLSILLVPDRPYLGLEVTTEWRRRMVFTGAVRKAGEAYIGGKQQIPSETNPRDLGRLLDAYRDPEEGVDSLSYALHLPGFSRFSFGENWTRPFEINKAIAGRKIIEPKDQVEEHWVWWIRPPYGSKGHQSWGLMVDLNWGQVKTTRDTTELGYEH